MAEGKFTRREVHRSFRKFRDIASDLIRARYQTWSANLRRLIDHCETDRVMRVVTDPLRNNPNVDVDRWYQDFLESSGGMVGSEKFRLPADDDEQTSLFYQ